MDNQTKVYISFDYDNDRQYKYLMEAWTLNPNLEFKFSDKSAHEIKSDNISRVKAGLTQYIKDATHLLVIVGKEANKKHPDSNLIGDINWINWEINTAKELNKKLVALKLNSLYESPDAIINSGAAWAMSFKLDSIIDALSRA